MKGRERNATCRIQRVMIMRRLGGGGMCVRPTAHEGRDGISAWTKGGADAPRRRGRGIAPGTGRVPALAARQRTHAHRGDDHQVEGSGADDGRRAELTCTLGAPKDRRGGAGRCALRSRAGSVQERERGRATDRLG